jgi:hypothetical protein
LAGRCYQGIIAARPVMRCWQGPLPRHLQRLRAGLQRGHPGLRAIEKGDESRAHESAVRPWLAAMGERMGWLARAGWQVGATKASLHQGRRCVAGSAPCPVTCRSWIRACSEATWGAYTGGQSRAHASAVRHGWRPWVSAWVGWRVVRWQVGATNGVVATRPVMRCWQCPLSRHLQGLGAGLQPPGVACKRRGESRAHASAVRPWLAEVVERMGWLAGGALARVCFRPPFHSPWHGTSVSRSRSALAAASS